MNRLQRSKPATVKVGNITVKIYTRERATATGIRRLYEVADYSNGRRCLRGFSDAKEARTEAERIARQLSTGEATAATMRNSEAASYGRAIELLRPSGVSLEVATATFAECFGLLGGNALLDAARFYVARHRKTNAKAVSNVVAELLAVKESRGAALRYMEDLRSRLKRVSQVTLERLQTARDELLALYSASA